MTLWDEAQKHQQKAQELFAECDNYAGEIAGLEGEADRLQEEISAAKNEADAIATDFKELFAEASAAYEDGDGAEAAELASQGRGQQAACRALNEQVSNLINMAAGLHTRIRRLRQEKERCHQAAMEHIRTAQELRGQVKAAQKTDKGYTVIAAGFQHAGFQDSTVAQYLRDTVPSEHLRKLRRVLYIDEAGAAGGETARDGSVIVYRLRGSSQDSRRIELRIVLLHEIGELVHLMVLNAIDQARFSRIMEPWPSEIAQRGTHASDVFAECYRLYLQDPQYLARVNPERFRFLRERVFK